MQQSQTRATISAGYPLSRHQPRASDIIDLKGMNMLRYSRTIGLLAAMSLFSPASAESYFTCMNPLEQDALLELGTITSDGPGVVEVYDYHLGQRGDLLGTVDVNEGANADVRMNIGMPPLGDVLAVLTIDGEVAATNVYDVCGD